MFVSTERQIPPTTETRSRPLARPVPHPDLVCTPSGVCSLYVHWCGRACRYPTLLACI
ncbi:Uncharacterized protein APZ42_021773 [Daphnia magna]|uniref:Uncharacterized protein n=1 Tax=Daphnia magna TaxID=35525 RepID=A0A164WD07_9CRUS|nr:Uncharacterized protein APZ42_021773 [Daphnia magna]